MKTVVAWGGGTNSTAMLIGMARRSTVPDLILFADPGHEWPHTYKYRDEVMQPWLSSIGFPAVVTVSKKTQLSDKKDFQRETLGDQCGRLEQLPSVAFGMKSCSDKFKIRPQVRYIESLGWDFPVRNAVGFDAGEYRRAERQIQKEDKDERFDNWYPLIEWGIDRDGCVELIRSAGLPQPGKSSWFFCPNNKRHEWERLREEHPDLFSYAVDMSRRASAAITNPSVGLMRCNPSGKRELHRWADGEYDQCPLFETDNDMPCGCVD